MNRGSSVSVPKVLLILLRPTLYSIKFETSYQMEVSMVHCIYGGVKGYNLYIYMASKVKHSLFFAKTIINLP